MNKETALCSIVDLATEHQLSTKEIVKALRKADIAEVRSNLTTKLFAYLGGIFVLAGVGVFIASFWGDLGTLGRILSTFGTGLGMYCTALLIARRTPLSKASTPLFLVGAALQCTGLYVAYADLGLQWDVQNTSILILGALTFQYLLTFWVVERTTPLFVALTFGTTFFATIFDKLHFDAELNALIVGFSLLCVSHAIRNSRHSSITSLLYFFGSCGLFWGSFELLEEIGLDILFLGLCSFLVFISTLAKSRTLLFTSCIALLSYIGYFTRQHFVDSLGWPIALITLGFLCIGVSTLAIKLNKKI